ncbi:hypothetical protein [Enterobacter sp. CPE_E423]
MSKQKEECKKETLLIFFSLFCPEVISFIKINLTARLMKID